MKLFLCHFAEKQLAQARAVQVEDRLQPQNQKRSLTLHIFQDEHAILEAGAQVDPFSRFFGDPFHHRTCNFFEFQFAGHLLACLQKEQTQTVSVAGFVFLDPVPALQGI